MGLAEGTPELAGSSLKAASDLDWDDSAAVEQALGAVGRVEALAAGLGSAGDPRVAWGLAAAVVSVRIGA